MRRRSRSGSTSPRAPSWTLSPLLRLQLPSQVPHLATELLTCTAPGRVQTETFQSFL